MEIDMKDAVATMGDILPDDVGGRDAVHVAVISAKATTNLLPGQDVGFTDGGESAGPSETFIGIVDPFLKNPVSKGQRFWLYLYPRTITGLSHRWTHPALDNHGSGEAYSPPSRQLSSEQWLRAYADDIDVGYRDLLRSADEWIKYGEYMCRGATLEGVGTSPEFWDHYEAVTGKRAPNDKRDNFFTCSC